MTVRLIASIARAVIVLWVLSLLACVTSGGARAQDAATPSQQPSTSPMAQTPPIPRTVAPEGRGNTPGSPAAAEQHRLPPDSVTNQTLALPGRTLAFTAIAGSIRLFDDKGEPQADIATTSYQLDGADARNRPV